jgi:hypothetical protein
MKITDIRWKNNANTGGVSASDAYNAIEQIRHDCGGELSADDVLKKAKRKTHVLHPVFEWDDTKAAAEHRRTQARTLLRSIEIVYEERPEMPVRSHQITVQKKRGDEEGKTLYTTTEKAFSDPATRDLLVAKAIRDAMQFRRRFQVLRELQLIFDAIDKTVDQLAEQLESIKD